MPSFASTAFAQDGNTLPALASTKSGDNEAMTIVSAALHEQLQRQQQHRQSHHQPGEGENALITQQQDGKKGGDNATRGYVRSDSGSALMVAPTRDVSAASTAAINSAAAPDAPPLINEPSASQHPSMRQDAISSVLPPPEHYAVDAGAIPPHEPRQYLDWKFHEMNLVVASDAVICRPQGGAESNEGDAADSRSTAASQALTVRVADVHELQSQMKLYQETKRLKAADNTGEKGADTASSNLLPPSNDQKHFYPSYARALLSEGSSERTYQVGGDHEVDAAMASPLHTATVPPTPIDSAIGNAGYISSPPPSSDADMPESSPVTSLPPSGASTPSSSPVVTVLDAYLDNVMANVPQLALCLQDKGYIQSVKLLQTEDIPSTMMDATTYGFDDPLDGTACGINSSGEPLFSPQMVDMNATMLLRFLKANCSRENTTYLLRRGAGETNIQLYDISSLSSQRQKKWTWWLAMMSYRFALRLSQMSRTFVPEDDRAMKRNFRTRERSLLQNALELLEELDDMDGGKHETISAAIHEHLAGTFLLSDATSDVAGAPRASTSADTGHVASQPLPTTSGLQPYENLSRDALSKAQDHLSSGIKKLQPVLESKRRAEKDRLVSRQNRRKEKIRSPPRRSNVRIESWYSSSSSSSDMDEDEESSPLPSSPEIEALSVQLYGLLHKKVNVSLRLAEHHLRDYRSSCAMQELRATARIIADIVSLLRPLGHLMVSGDNEQTPSPFLQSIRYQYAWLWEYCGHFARSFASDKLWREKGHTSGEDIVSLLQEVQAACCQLALRNTNDDGQDSPLWIGSTSSDKDHAKTVLITLKTQGLVSLRSPTPLVAAPSEIDPSGERKDGPSAVEVASSILRKQTLLKRERRFVLVAASVCYGRAAAAYLALQSAGAGSGNNGDIPPPPTVFVEEKTDDPLLHSSLSPDAASRDSSILLLLRQRLGDTCNEVGKALLTEAKAILETPFANAEGNKDELKATGPFLLSAKFWFSESLRHFEASNDLRNIALLRCNLCQCCKIRANTSVALPKLTDKSSDGSSVATHAEICLQQAADHLQRAHERLGDRDADAMTWDMVSTELAATLLVLGVRRRQTLLGRAATPVVMQALRLNPGSERRIIEPMEQSIQIYEALGNGHQAAAANYQLALYYSKVWTCQRDETKTRAKLSAAFKCFGAAHQYFFSAMRGNEPTFVILSLDFAGLFSSVSGQKESAEKALRCCIDTCDAFSREAICAASQRHAMHSKLPDDKEWFDKMCALGDAVEDKVLKLLQELVKMEKSDGGDTYKSMYRAALLAKMAGKKAEASAVTSKEAFASDPDSCSMPVYDLLKQLKGFKN